MEPEATIGAAQDWEAAIARARAEAPFLARLLDREAAIAAMLQRGEGEAALAAARAAGAEPEHTAVALRRERRALALALAIGDLAGAFSLRRVTAELSAFADRALDAAIDEAIRHRAPDAEPAGFAALALGKHGAGELNYSSDIDPILLYDPALLPRRPRDEPGEAAQLIARRIVQTLSHRDAEGYVFRVDLRLRPASEVSPLAISWNAALTHYESSALAWERAAFIRARPAAGDIGAAEDFLASIRPFVWRKSLDFGAIDDIGRLVRRIRETHSGPIRPGFGFDLKRGRGGIREVEFYTQTHQLIHGGRDPSLRLRGTRAALDALAAAGIIAADDAEVMGTAYDRLRAVEHRLQMIADQQTHVLPGSAEALDAAARLDGMADGAALVADLDGVTSEVGRRFDALLATHGGDPGSADRGKGATVAVPARLAELGFTDPDGLARRIAGWQEGKVKALRSDAAREAFGAILPAMLPALAAAPEPERALLRFEQLLAQLPSAINVFRLLAARPALPDMLARILALAPVLADSLTRRGDLLDTLIDGSAFDLPGPVEEIAADFRQGGHDDYEALLDQVRRKVGEARFALGVQLIENARHPLDIAAAQSRVAEAAIRVLAEAAGRGFAETHGHVPGGGLVVMGLGRLGGGALTHASDLDIVYLFTGDFDAQSDGRRPLGATQYFNRLAQRVSAALSVPTAEGALFQVDTRLRPSGMQGLLAVSIDSFARYQREAAWTWEHMALTRARVIAGPAGIAEPLAAEIRAILSAPRDRTVLRREVLGMRAEISRHKPPKGPLDVKLARGGLVDVEFLTHFNQLRTGIGMTPDLRSAIAALEGTGALPQGLGEAHALLTSMLIALRLLAPDGAEPPPAARAVLARACGAADWRALMSAMDKAHAKVAEGWAASFDERLEDDA